MMRPEVLQGVFIPFLGTVLGSAFVFFLKGEMPRFVQRALTGFAAGVMTAASVWSLLIPAMDQSEHLGKLAFLPAFIGLWVGVLFLLATLVFGRQINGAKNWIIIGGLSMQPSELSKICFVFVGASAMDRIMTKRNIFMFIIYCLN